jgi:hypothetical protein
MKALIVIVGGYVAIGLAVGVVALLRYKVKPLHMLEGLTPFGSVAACMALWPLILVAERSLALTRRRLSRGPIRTDWVVTEFQVPEAWIKDPVARLPQEFDWKAEGLTPVDNPGVKELLDMMVVGDELRRFSSDAESWQRLAGRAGFVLLRKRQQVAHLTTTMN